MVSNKARSRRGSSSPRCRLRETESAAGEAAQGKCHAPRGWFVGLVAIQQRPVARDLEYAADRRVEPRLDGIEEQCFLRRQRGDVSFRQLKVSLEQTHLYVVYKVRKKGHRAYISRRAAASTFFSRRQPRPNAEPARDDLPGLVHPNTHVIARRLSNPLLVAGRRDGRNPMRSAPSRSTGVDARKYSASPLASIRLRYRS